MSFDLETAKLRLGIADDDTYDAVITATMDAALNIVEKYLDRKLLLADESETIYYPFPNTHVRRWPIQAITRVSIGGNNIEPPYYVIDMQAGWVQFGTWGVWRDWPPASITPGGRLGPELILEYSGGFDPLPPEIEIALWGVFDRILPTLQPSLAVASSGSGALKSISLPDVGRFDFESGSSASGGGSVPGDAFAAIYGPYFYSILQPYMRMRV